MTDNDFVKIFEDSDKTIIFHVLDIIETLFCVKISSPFFSILILNNNLDQFNLLNGNFVKMQRFFTIKGVMPTTITELQLILSSITERLIMACSRQCLKIKPNSYVMNVQTFTYWKWNWRDIFILPILGNTIITKRYSIVKDKVADMTFIGYDLLYLGIICGHLVRDFESEAKTRGNF